MVASLSRIVRLPLLLLLTLVCKIYDLGLVGQEAGVCEEPAEHISSKGPLVVVEVRV